MVTMDTLVSVVDMYILLIYLGQCRWVIVWQQIYPTNAPIFSLVEDYPNKNWTIL